jgi:DNA-binding NarL/FixJ family response regulator
MVEGLAANAITKHPGVATKTVENHKIRIFDKLGVRTQAHAVAVAISHGLRTPGGLVEYG